jgi:hypothetical protein
MLRRCASWPCRLPRCGSTQLMVGVETAKDTRVSMAQDAGRIGSRAATWRAAPRAVHGQSGIGDSVGLTDAVRVQARAQ